MANRKVSRIEEIEVHGKQISMRPMTYRSRKTSDGNEFERRGLKDFPLFFVCFFIKMFAYLRFFLYLCNSYW